MMYTNTILRLAVSFITLRAWCAMAQLNYKVPTDNEICQTRKMFSALPRPIEYSVERSTTPLLLLCSIKLRGAASSFANSKTFPVLAYALWPMLDVPKSNAEAAIILLGASGEQFSDQALTYVDASTPGNWSRLGGSYVENCKRTIRLALHQPDWWYPHPVLFDREKVLAECKDNPIARASYIAAMQKALADPNIRTENPLGVDETLGVLSALHAVEAAPTYVSYLLFDRTTGGDFRLATTNAMQLVDKTDSLPFENCLPQLKLKVAPLVLARIANATHDEMSCEIGGGGLPLLSINYFWLMHIREAQAVECVEAFIRAHQDYAEQQIANLDTILDAIKTKKYRPFFMNGSDWSAPVAANAPPTKP